MHGRNRKNTYISGFQPIIHFAEDRSGGDNPFLFSWNLCSAKMYVCKSGSESGSGRDPYTPSRASANRCRIHFIIDFQYFIAEPPHKQDHKWSDSPGNSKSISIRHLTLKLYSPGQDV